MWPVAWRHSRCPGEDAGPEAAEPLGLALDMVLFPKPIARGGLSPKTIDTYAQVVKSVLAFGRQ
jgi:hypothetical protein